MKSLNKEVHLTAAINFSKGVSAAGCRTFKQPRFVPLHFHMNWSIKVGSVTLLQEVPLDIISLFPLTQPKVRTRVTSWLLIKWCIPFVVEASQPHTKSHEMVCMWMSDSTGSDLSPKVYKLEWRDRQLQAEGKWWSGRAFCPFILYWIQVQVMVATNWGKKSQNVLLKIYDM